MNILYHFRTRGIGAEGVHIAGMADAFEALGHRVDFSSPTQVDPRATAGADPFVCAGRSGRWARLAARAPQAAFELLEVGYNLVAAWRNARRLRRKGADLIYERHAFFLCSTAWLATRRGIPLVVEVNELAGDERVRAQPRMLRLAAACDRFCFRRATLIVVVSPHLQRRIVSMGIAEDKILVLPNAVSDEALVAPEDGVAARRRHRFGDALVVGFVGWLVHWHRLDRLVRAFAALDVADRRLLIVGDGPLRSSLAELSRSLGVGDEVVFTGAAPHDTVRQYLAAMDIGVIPHSNAYRSPIKLFEYMAAGLAVAAPRTEPIAMVVESGKNGMLFDPEAVDGLADALAPLAADAPLRDRIGRQAATDVRERHTWRHNAERVLAAAEARRADGGRPS